MMPGPHWTAKSIQETADAFEARGAGRITLAAETIVLMVAALRYLGREGLAERRSSYTVDVWDDSEPHRRAHRHARNSRRSPSRVRRVRGEAEERGALRQGIWAVDRRSAAP